MMGAVTSLAEIVHRAHTIWPLGSVPYSMASAKSPTGHRQDCSGYASACLGLPPPGESTVTLVTEGHVRRIGWGELAPGDLVGRMGPGTWGAAGHVAVVTGVHRGLYVVMEQRGGGPGPVRSTYPLGSPAGYLPYRSVAIEEDDMVRGIIVPVKGGGIGLVYPHPLTGEMVWQNAGTPEAVEAWQAAGWPKAKPVNKIESHGRNAREVAADILDAMRSGGAGPVSVEVTPGKLVATTVIEPAAKE